MRSWNPAAERLFGYTADETIGRSISVIIPHDRLGEEAEILARLSRRERIEHFETTRRAKDGRMLTVPLTVSPVVDAEGRIIGGSKIVRDLTERRNVEHALRESGFRTLADNIAQLAWMADETGSVFWYNERWLNYTGMSIEQMKGWGWRTVHHPDHVENVTRKFRAAIDTGTIWEDTFPLRGRDDQFRWPAPGRVVLTALRQVEHVEITISDTGVGIEPAMLERVFEMFQQGQKVGSTLGQGLGIGLTLVKALVELHGGSVKAQSAGQGQGSQFVVRLPCVAISDQPRQMPRAASSTPCKPLSILVADDNADAADLLRMLLERQGHKVLAVYDGRSALAEAPAFAPDVMLLDLGMPEPDGYEVARRVRSTPWGLGVVLVALTGWGQTDDRARTQRAGFSHHLLKPANFSELCKLLDDIAAARDAVDAPCSGLMPPASAPAQHDEPEPQAHRK